MSTNKLCVVNNIVNNANKLYYCNYNKKNKPIYRLEKSYIATQIEDNENILFLKKFIK